MNKRQLFKAVGVGFALTVSALPVSSDYYYGKRENGKTHNGYFYDPSVFGNAFNTHIDRAASIWRDEGTSPKIQREMARQGGFGAPRPTGLTDRWYVENGLGKVSSRQYGLTITSYVTVADPKRPPGSKNRDIRECSVTLYKDNIDNRGYDLQGDVYMDFVTSVALHEFGHTLKLEHPGENSSAIKREIPQGQFSIMDSNQFTPNVGFPRTIGQYDQEELYNKWEKE